MDNDVSLFIRSAWFLIFLWNCKKNLSNKSPFCNSQSITFQLKLGYLSYFFIILEVLSIFFLFFSARFSSISSFVKCLFTVVYPSSNRINNHLELYSCFNISSHIMARGCVRRQSTLSFESLRNNDLKFVKIITFYFILRFKRSDNQTNKSMLKNVPENWKATWQMRSRHFKVVFAISFFLIILSTRLYL